MLTALRYRALGAPERDEDLAVERAAGGRGVKASGGRSPRGHGWTPGAAHGASVARIAVLLALASGPVGLGLALHGNTPSTAPMTASAGVSASVGESAAVGNFAQEFVTAWLTAPAGQESSLSFYVQDTAGLQLPQTPPSVQNVAVADVERLGTYRAGGDGEGAGEAAGESTSSSAASSAGGAGLRVAWAVTVAADVSEPGQDGATVMVRRYFAVSVLQQSQTASAPAAAAAGGGPGWAFRALLWPQPVSGPTSGQGADLAYSQEISPSSALASSVQQFLGAYLAGQGDVSRYLTPGVQMHAITPAPYAGVQVQSVLGGADDPVGDTPGEGQRAQVLVTAALTNLSQQRTSTQYALALTARAGRWEVTALQASPAVDLAPVEANAAAISSAATSGAAAGASSGTGEPSSPQSTEQPSTATTSAAPRQ